MKSLDFVSAFTCQLFPLKRSGARFAKIAMAGSLVMLISSTALAANGIWISTTDQSLWSTPSNWSGGTIADGTGALADFSTVDIAAATTVNLDSTRTVGQLKFQDTNNTSAWILANNGATSNVLTLNNGAIQPVIDVLNQSLTITANLAGTSGFRKIDAGGLILSGDNSALSGQVLFSRGDVTVQSNTALGTGTVVIDPGTTVNTRLILTANLTLANPITMNSSNSGGGANGSILTNGAFDATLTGNITINALATAGGHWAGSTGTNYLNITGSVTDTLP
ncbi:MAG TPA: hypothetical protein VGI75_05385, partial [Pirellulales bacterium]